MIQEFEENKIYTCTDVETNEIYIFRVLDNKCWKSIKVMFGGRVRRFKKSVLCKSEIFYTGIRTAPFCTTAYPINK